MAKHKNRWSQHKNWAILFASLFIVSLITIGYVTLQSHNNSPIPAGLHSSDKDYGVTANLIHLDVVSLEKITNSLREDHLTWLRQPVNWADIEPAPGQFDWSALDQLFDTLARQSPALKIIVVLQTTPNWARPPNTSNTLPPTEVSDFGNFARALAQRYGHQIDAYQIWHEPNLSAQWGHTFVDPVAYSSLLREASLNIRAVDADAIILTAALAPTLETGPINLNELDYLDQLYQTQAQRWFDAVAGQAYGFNSEPADPARTDTLNFNRVALLRQVMLNHYDADTPIWVTAFGWNALPTLWNGQPSPWNSDTENIQAQRTVEALAHARRNWPWLGPMLAIRWSAEGLATDDPARGFALTETPQILQAIAAAASKTVATPGQYPAGHASGQTSPGWRFAPTHADIPHDEPRTLTISFEGTRLDLSVNRGPYKGYLWVTVDGQPANALPQNNLGQSYVVLYDPLYGSETVTLAQNLPYGRHVAAIKADGGWGQWAISGWLVANETNPRPPEALLFLTIAVLIGSGMGLFWCFWAGIMNLWQGVVTLLQSIIAATHKTNDPAQMAIFFMVAFTFYFTPEAISLLLLPILALAFLLRPDLGLMLIVFSLSFFQAPKRLLFKDFSPVELGLILTATGFIFRESFRFCPTRPLHLSRPTLRSMDWAALVLVVLALLATLAAPNFGVSMHEWRLVVTEPVIFYFMVRLGRDYGPAAQTSNWRWAWRLVDALVAGAALHALLALYLYFFTDQSITTEGVRRALGPVYGSPNNLSLFLDRVWPILLAVALFRSQTTINSLRRGLYASGLVLVSLTLYLTFSKGALLLGLPAAVVAMAVIYTLRHPQHRRRVIGIAAGCLTLLAVVLIPLSQTQRFRTTFNINQGSTGFFRLKLWEASLNMLHDYWPLGVGLDNFLYQYRTRYILPEAWAEPNLSHPHNLILDFGTRIGIGGIAWLAWTQVAFWQNAWKLYQMVPASLVLGLMGSMVVLLTHGLVDNSFFLVDLAFIFFLTAGIVQTLRFNTFST
jgi:hypothetical protein